MAEDPRRILLVEDDDEDALIVSDLLGDTWPRLVIERASSVSEAVGKLPGAIDCVLLDLGLPDALGLDAMQRIRETDPEMPVVVHDLPGGARRLKQTASGFLATVVAGEIVHREGRHTGALPGALVRGPLGTR